MATSAHEDPRRFDDKLCSDLTRETEQYLARAPKGELHWYFSDSPLMVVMNASTTELDREMAQRIYDATLIIAYHGCIDRAWDIVDILEAIGVSPNPTFGEVLDAALRFEGLDRSQENWGLRTLPEIDFEIHTEADLVDMMATIPEPEDLYKSNNLRKIGRRKFFQKYDLSDPKDRETARNLRAPFSLEINDTETIGSVLDKLAQEAGLRLK